MSDQKNIDNRPGLGNFRLKRHHLAALAALLIIAVSATWFFSGSGSSRVASETTSAEATGQAQIDSETNGGLLTGAGTETIQMTTSTSAVETSVETTTGTTFETTVLPTTAVTSAKPVETTAKPKETAAPTAAPTEIVTPLVLAGTGKVNILLIGSDARAGLDGARSDSTILLTFDSDSSQIKLTSFMRDMYVAIPGHGSTKINAAFNYGGESLLIETIQNNFAIDVEHYITIRFESFIAVVDQIGGISLELNQKEIDYINAEIGGIPDGAGVKTLTGAQTLSHCRNRRVGNGDFTRTSRQRATIKAIFSKIQQQNDAATLARLVGFSIGNVKTNISADQLLTLTTTVMGGGDVSFSDARVPFDGTWSYATKNGASVIEVDFTANRDLIRQFIDG